MPTDQGFQVRRAEVRDRIPLGRMLELYQHDLSDIWDQDLDDHGEYGYELGRFWASDMCYAFVLTSGDSKAGFALVDGAVKVGEQGYWMDQFFILKKYRRQGAGQFLANHVFATLPGRWEVGQMPENKRAQTFWRDVIARYTADRYTEHTLTDGWWQGYVQCFENVGAPAP
jgi:predicted acetyltransferase